MTANRRFHTRSGAVLAILAAAGCTGGRLAAQEARFGFADPMTVSFFSAHSQRGPSSPGRTPVAFRANFYPTLKLGGRWFAYGAVQAHSTPYFYEELTSRARHIDLALLQAYVGYSLVADGRALTIKAGQLTSAFGSFPLRYDDARNWLIDLPQSYGYYYFPVTVHGMPGAEVDVTLGKVDGRVQLTASSPSNPRHWWDRDQYANWTAGAGVTIRQGFRIGASAMHGPYLHRQHRFFFPGEVPPKRLPATGYGLDVQWARGRWNLNGEAHRFQYPYRAIPYFFNTLAYAEAKWSLHPRWYLAGRTGSRWRTAGLGRDHANEFVIAFRPAPGHLLKAGYLLTEGAPNRVDSGNVFGVQYVMSFNPDAVTWDRQ